MYLLSCRHPLRYWSLLGQSIVVSLLCLNVATAEPLKWFDARQPSARAWEAVDILASAATEGLAVQDYAPETLRTMLQSSKDGTLPEATLGKLDAAMTETMTRYLNDLHRGRIRPQLIGENFSVANGDNFDATAALNTALHSTKLSQGIAAFAPNNPMYKQLRDALAHYRLLAADPSVVSLWRTPLPALSATKLEPENEYAGVGVLMRRLSVLGDLGGALPKLSKPPRYEGAVVEAVKVFQKRHGLVPDGVIGKVTFEQLGVSPAARVAQIEIAMERLRWMPVVENQRSVVVNVPERMLRAYRNDGTNNRAQVEMRVIVGNAMETRTPIFDEEMRFVEFSPYWNVPSSIAKAELVPRLKRDPAHFAEQGFEFVGADGGVSAELTEDNLNGVLRGQMRIRQRPGPKNALGDIKFSFPNKDSIYLHHTPTPNLFKRERRDYSHGCIRVEDPVALAKFVLSYDPAWSEDRIRTAMEKGKSATLRLRETVRVVIEYQTARVDENGRIHFFPDMYQQDQRLVQALRTRTSKLPAHDVLALN